ncbi:MAG TPA: hypothetical protein VEH86_01615 [Candidatus Acidoferrum sp.]|nr:hypothetical protein [Candidatus Acidoferrum sp.]
MNSNCDNFIDIPCFKCLFWDPTKESHLHCNPNECKELTEWLMKLVLMDEKTETLIIALPKKV